MMYEHYTHPDILAEKVSIEVAGAGGSGSQLVSGLARLNAALRALNHPGIEVHLHDPDNVSEANLGRQLFAPADVGHNKADVLINRINAWFGTAWQATPRAYRGNTHRDRPGFVITCVDSARARVQIGRAITGGWNAPLYWMDLGNRAADGQMVLGIPPRNDEHKAFEFRLPTVLELFPQIATDATTLDRDTGPSCSLADALERQELFINQLVVTQALQLLWQIFRYGRTTWHGSFINATSGRIAPLPVDPQAWARLGYTPKHVKEKS